MQQGVVCNHMLKFVVLVLTGQMAVQEQIADFEVRALLGQLFNRVAAIHERPFIAINKGNGAFAGGGGEETRIISEHTQVGIETPDIDDGWPVCTSDDREFDGLPAGIVCQCYRVFSHNPLFLSRIDWYLLKGATTRSHAFRVGQTKPHWCWRGQEKSDSNTGQSQGNCDGFMSRP